MMCVCFQYVQQHVFVTLWTKCSFLIHSGLKNASKPGLKMVVWK